MPQLISSDTDTHEISYPESYPDEILIGGLGGVLNGQSTYLSNLKAFDIEVFDPEKLSLKAELEDINPENDPSISEELRITFIKSSLEAKNLIDLFPNDLPKPSILLEPEGSIGFEWFAGKGKIFVISLDGSGTLIYAGMNEKERTKGTITLSAVFPQRLAMEIMNLFQKKT